MSDHRGDVMVALRPITSDWARIALPHLTLVYAGSKGDLRPYDFNALAKTVSTIGSDFREIMLYTDGLTDFGPESDRVEVIKLKPTPQLMAMRLRVADWDKSEFPFTPHCTVGPITDVHRDPPIAIAFDRVMLSWGEEELNFRLKP